MLDAWIANQDRHHENWGSLWDGEHQRLAPTFDHGAALARNVLDSEREERLNTRDRNRTIADEPTTAIGVCIHMNSLFVAWRPPVTDRTGWRPVGRLEHDGDLYRFWYTRGAEKPGFRAFLRMEQLDAVYESEKLFPLFANRLLSESRPEYDAFMRWSGFDLDSPPDPIVVLGVTEGIRQTDAVEVFPCPVPGADGCYVNKFFLHGIRWLADAILERIGRLEEGEPLKLMLDLQNDHDRQAVAVRTEGERMLIGYVPRYLAHDVWELIQSCEVDFIELHVDRVNKDAPLQNRVLSRMHACWPEGFQPCSSEDFMPIPAGVPTKCVE